MGRLDEIRQIRKLRQKYAISVVIFLVILLAGICATDYSLNSLICNISGLNLARISKQGPYIDIFFMNQKVSFDLEYIDKDINWLRKISK